MSRTMKPQDRERLLRNILSGLLSSALTPVELRQAANELELGPLANDLARLIRINVEALRERRPSYSDAVRSTKENLVDTASSLVTDRRISKKSLLALMSGFAPNSWISLRNSKSTTRQLLKEFFEYVNTEDAGGFINLLESSQGEVDPYLRGISNRST
jgi:hypothetical protein